MLKVGAAKAQEFYNKQRVTRYYLELLHKHGICTKCGEMYSHSIDEPFASCDCGTSEWYNLTPYMELEKKIDEIYHLVKTS